MALPVVTSYQFIAITGGGEVVSWIKEHSEMGFELKSVIYTPENTVGLFTVMMQRPWTIVDGEDGWSYPDAEG
jgi:hypothetical protein